MKGGTPLDGRRRPDAEHVFRQLLPDVPAIPNANRPGVPISPVPHSHFSYDRPADWFRGPAEPDGVQ